MKMPLSFGRGMIYHARYYLVLFVIINVILDLYFIMGCFGVGYFIMGGFVVGSFTEGLMNQTPT